MLLNLYDWKIDPDNRQDRCSGKCECRPMTDEEWRRYGPVNTAQRVGFMLYAKEPDNIFAKVHTG